MKSELKRRRNNVGKQVVKRHLQHRTANRKWQAYSVNIGAVPLAFLSQLATSELLLAPNFAIKQTARRRSMNYDVMTVTVLKCRART